MLLLQTTADPLRVRFHHSDLQNGDRFMCNTHIESQSEYLTLKWTREEIMDLRKSHCTSIAEPYPSLLHLGLLGAFHKRVA